MTTKVLLVDDTEHVRRMLQDMLELQGFEIVGHAANASQAMDRLLEASPDVVVMDLKMPEVDGITATRWLRERNPDLAVILYSAYLTDEHREAAEEAGVLVCVDKVAGIESLGREIAAAALTARPDASG